MGRAVQKHVVPVLEIPLRMQNSFFDSSKWRLDDEFELLLVLHNLTGFFTSIVKVCKTETKIFIFEIGNTIYWDYGYQNL